jgi:aerobic carbon-monoxide dehydrogenase medium subunit
MISTKLLYHRPKETKEACNILAEHSNEVVVLGGGSMLVPQMNRQEVNANHVVDLRALGLDTIMVNEDYVEIGAKVTYSEILASEAIEKAVPLLQEVSNGITGGNQVRNLGTLVGSACYANPSSDIPAVLVALKARIRICGTQGVREIDAADFILGAFKVDLRAGEFVTAFALPSRNLRTGYYKLKISGSSWPIATATAIIDEETGETTVTLGSIEGRPLQINLPPTANLETDLRAEDVTNLVRAQVKNPWSDILATCDYRREVSGVVARRALERALGRTIK